MPPGTTLKVSSACHPTLAPKVYEILATPQGSKVTNIWSIGVLPDHNNGRCIDFMIRNLTDGQALADYIYANRERYGVRIIIWNRRITRSYPKPGIAAWQWSAYSGSSPHTDHPHVEFNDQPMGGTAVKPGDATGAIPLPGDPVAGIAASLVPDWIAPYLDAFKAINAALEWAANPQSWINLLLILLGILLIIIALTRMSSTNVISIVKEVTK